MKRALVVLGHLMILNVIYILSIFLSLGIAVAPATSALFYFSNKLLSKDFQEYGIIKQFRKIIKEKFKYSFGFGIIAAVILYLCIVNLDNVLLLEYGEFLRKLIIVCQYFAIIETSVLTIMVLYLNGLFKFQKFSDLIKMAFFVAHRHIFVTILMVISIALLLYVLVYYVTILLLIMFFSLISLWICTLYLPIWKKYLIKEEEHHNEPPEETQ
jgi:uncharacterized membrane protein YesL